MKTVVGWIRRLDEYFSRDGWSLIAFQPILFLFVFGAAIRLWITHIEPIIFVHSIDGFYPIWLALAVVGPLQALLAWYLIEKCHGIWSFIGIWVRLSADVQVFTVVASYQIVATDNTAVHIFSRYISSSVLVFIMGLIVRDVWVIYVTERLAYRIRRVATRE